MVTTVIFDLSEVYLHGMKNVEKQLGDVMGIKIPLNTLYLEKEAQLFFNGDITEEAFFQNIINKKHWNLTPSTFKDIMRAKMVEIEGVREIIEKLRKNGYVLGLLSVHGKEWIEYCEEKFDYHKLFHSVVYSYEIKVSKPDPRAFVHIMQRLKAKPQDCLFIDDSKLNIRAAERLGMHTICFENAKQLTLALRALKMKL